MATRSSLPSGFDPSKTLFFPISGNPIGFNHFAAAEWILRARSSLERVLFVLSSGRHPDPKKSDANVGPQARLHLCEVAISVIGDPEQSYFAQCAERSRETPGENSPQPLHLTPSRLGISTVEFGFGHAARSAEVIPLLQVDDSQPLHWFAGSDLIARMADPEIFGTDDLAFLAEHLHYHVFERKGAPLSPALAALEKKRGVRLNCDRYPLSEIPAWLLPFLELSSTLIRNAAAAGDPLGGMLPHPAAEEIVVNGLYRQEGAAPLREEIIRLREELEATAVEAAALLTAARNAGRPHTLSIVENTAGGLLTAALAGIAGASRYFLQSRFTYDKRSKTALLGGAIPGGSAVSAPATEAMAAAMAREAGSAYALAESGMAGPPDGKRRSMKNGQCWIALASPAGVKSELVTLPPFLTRKEHQFGFASRALSLLRRELEGRG